MSKVVGPLSLFVAIAGLGAAVSGIAFPVAGLDWPTWIWWVLGVGGLTIMIIGVLGALLTFPVWWYMLRRKRHHTKEATGLVMTLPFKWWGSLKQLSIFSSTDAVFGEGCEGDYALNVDARFQVLRPAEVDAYSFELMGEFVPGKVIDGSLLTRNCNRLLYFLIPAVLCKVNATVTLIAHVSGQNIPSENTLQLEFESRS